MTVWDVVIGVLAVFGGTLVYVLARLQR